MTPIVRYFSLVGLFCANILMGMAFAIAQMSAVAMTHMSMGVIVLGLLMSEGESERGNKAKK